MSPKMMDINSNNRPSPSIVELFIVQYASNVRAKSPTVIFAPGKRGLSLSIGGCKSTFDNNELTIRIINSIDEGLAARICEFADEEGAEVVVAVVGTAAPAASVAEKLWQDDVADDLRNSVTNGSKSCLAVQLGGT